jgi:hypothetical protein
MLPFRTTGKLRIDDFRVRLEDCPGWVSGTTRLPLKGEAIFCAAGTGTVAALHGKTGDGSRLIQVELPSCPKRLFFAAASNVLLPPVGAETSAPRSGSTDAVGAAVWLGGSGSSAHLV